MKILSKQEKKSKKQEYKRIYNQENIDDAVIATYALNMPIKKYDKRITNYLYHYSRLCYKRDFLHKRIINLDTNTRKILFKNSKYFDTMTKVLKFKGMDEAKDKVWELENKHASDIMIVSAIENFYRFILEFSALIKQLSNILDEIDPKNKDKFKYSKTKDFVMGCKEIMLKIKYILREFTLAR